MPSETTLAPGYRGVHRRSGPGRARSLALADDRCGSAKPGQEI